MNEEFLIKKVSSNKEKGDSYTKNFGLFNKARKAECYFECMWILYSMIEDRTSALLYYLGFTRSNDRYKVTGTKKVKSQIRTMLKMSDEETQYKFDKLSGKIERIFSLIEWCQNDMSDLTDYQKIIRSAVLHVLKDDEFLHSLNYLQNEWREKRNQLAHALVVKDPSSVYSELASLVEKGYMVERTIDKAVRKIRNKHIREKYKIQ